MNYIETKEDFAPYTKITITNSAGASLSIIPEMGARLNNFLVPTLTGQQDIVDGYDSVEQLEIEYCSKSSLLAPFPNRTADGAYMFEGKTYQLPINKPKEHNSIHGFVSNKPFSLIRSGICPQGYALELEYSSGPEEGYPFPFTMLVTYILHEDNKVTVSTRLTNTGVSAIPAGFGWHPYFSLGTKVDDLELRLPEVEELEVDDRLIPTGDFHKVSEWMIAKGIADKNFDTGFRFATENKMIHLHDRERNIAIEIACGKGYDFFQVFTPPWRTSIAIEPMTCATDALNNGFGIKTLQPSESLSAEFSVIVRV